MFPLADNLVLPGDLRIEGTKCLSLLADRGGAGEYPSREIERPFGLCSWTGIEQWVRKLTVLKEELGNRECGSMEFQERGLSFDQIVDILVHAGTIVELLLVSLAYMQLVIPAKLGLEELVRGPTLSYRKFRKLPEIGHVRTVYDSPQVDRHAFGERCIDSLYYLREGSCSAFEHPPSVVDLLRSIQGDLDLPYEAFLEDRDILLQGVPVRHKGQCEVAFGRLLDQVGDIRLRRRAGKKRFSSEHRHILLPTRELTVDVGEECVDNLGMFYFRSMLVPFLVTVGA